MVSGHASSHPRGFQFGIEPLSQLDVFPRRSASREDIKLRYRFKPHWNPLGCEEAWSDTILYYTKKHTIIMGLKKKNLKILKECQISIIVQKILVRKEGKYW